MAVTLTAQRLEDATGVDPERAAELLAVVSDLVERYAPAAPESVQNEAALRCRRMDSRDPAESSIQFHEHRLTEPGDYTGLHPGGSVRPGPEHCRRSGIPGRWRFLSPLGRCAGRVFDLMRWPWSRPEVRMAQPYTDAVVRAI